MPMIKAKRLAKEVLAESAAGSATAKLAEAILELAKEIRNLE